MRQLTAFEQDFGGPGSQVRGEGNSMAGVGAENDCVAGRFAIICSSALAAGDARDAFGMPVEDRLPGIAEEDRAAPAAREFYFFKRGMQVPDAVFEAVEGRGGLLGGDVHLFEIVSVRRLHQACAPDDG